MKNDEGVPLAHGVLMILVMFLLTIVAQILFAESASADESSADSDRVYLHIFIPTNKREVEIFRVLPAMSVDECKAKREQLLLGPHSRAVGFCSRYFQHTGSGMVKFKTVGMDDARG